jgi:hypothetical protein
LDDSDDDEDKKKKASDSSWNPKAKVSPKSSKADRPHREGTQKGWAEKGLEEARNKAAARADDEAGPSSRGAAAESFERRLPSLFDSPALSGGVVRKDVRPGFRPVSVPKSPTSAVDANKR